MLVSCEDKEELGLMGQRGVYFEEEARDESPLDVGAVVLASKSRRRNRKLYSLHHLQQLRSDHHSQSQRSVTEGVGRAPRLVLIICNHQRPVKLVDMSAPRPHEKNP